MKHKLLAICGIAAISLFTNSCGGGGGDGANLGPADEVAFEGAVIAFNPTITFSAGGVIEYTNEEGDPFFGSEFPTTTEGNPESGTYTYTPNSGFASGVLTIDLPNIPYSADILVTDFITENGLVQGFKLNFPEEGIFDAQVLSGDIPSAPAPNTGNNGLPFATNSDGSIVAGTVITRTYIGGGSTILEDSSFPTILIPRTLGDQMTFIILPNGDIEFDIDYFPGRLSLPFVAVDQNIIFYRGKYESTGDNVTVAIEMKASGGVLSLKWEEDLLDNGAYDFETQLFQ